MTQDGYIKLWRKSLEDSLWQNISIWRFFEYCLLKATYREHTVLVGMQEIKLKPGQFVFGRKVASEESGLSEQVIRTCLKKLKNMKKLTIKPTNKFTVISIVNWARYQDEENQINQHINQQLTNKQPTTNHIQERKEGIRKERIKDYTLSGRSQNTIPYQEIIAYLNEKTGRDYKDGTPKTRTLINVLWKQGFQLQDFQKVIDNKVKDWITDQKYSKYLRPETLFGTKFEGYLNEQRHHLTGMVSEKTMRTIENLKELELE